MAETNAKQHIAPGTLTLYFDRGTSVCSETVTAADPFGFRLNRQPSACLG